MDLRTFPLIPFPGEPVPPGLALSGAIGRRGGTLFVRHTIEGAISALEIPSPAPIPERRDRLWEGTCLELFLGEAGSEGYREFNLSPAGHWNVYRFDSCRRGMRGEESIDALPFRVLREGGTLSAVLELETGGMFPPGAMLDAAVAAVVRTAAGAVSHWALVHPGPRPDFHRRDSFRIGLPGSP